MLQLYISNLPAILQKGASIKLTRENPLFNFGGDYTLEVTMPLTGCPENLRIFGALHHDATPVLPYASRKYPFRLLTGEMNIEGEAIVTETTEESVKVQLTAGRRTLEYAVPDDAYIDELDLGYFQRGRFPPDDERNYTQIDVDLNPDAPTPRGIAQYYYYLSVRNPSSANYEEFLQYTRGDLTETDGPCFPIYSTTEEKLINYQFAKVHTESGLTVYEFIPVAPQPYLLIVISRIMEALGYDFALTEELQGKWFSRVFIANSRPVAKLAKALPHWTLREFLQEVQNLLGCVFLVKGRKVTMRMNPDFYSDIVERCELKVVADDIQTNFDAEARQETSSAGNVDYDWTEEDLQLRLPDEVWENAAIQEYNSYAALVQAANALSYSVKKQSRYLFIDKSTGFVYAHLLDKSDDNVNTQWKLARIDYMPPLIRKDDSRDIDTDLRITPVRLTMNPLDEVEGVDEHGQPVTWRRTLPYPVMRTADTTLEGAEWYSVNAKINPSEEDDEREKKDAGEKEVLEVALWNGRSQYQYEDAGGHMASQEVPTSVGADTPETTGVIKAFGITNDDDVFRLTNTAAGVGKMLADSPAIDVRAERRLQFLDRNDYDPTLPYLIRNRLYACKRLELTITEEGLQPLKTGYFYPIEG